MDGFAVWPGGIWQSSSFAKRAAIRCGSSTELPGKERDDGKGISVR
jgi:hypothetical protein